MSDASQDVAAAKSRWGFDVNLVRKASYEDLEFDFTGSDPLKTPVTSTKVAIELIPLPGFSYPVVQARGKANIVIVSLVDLKFANIGKFKLFTSGMASVDTDWEPASMKGSNVRTTFTRTDMATNPDKIPEYSTFLAGLILTPSYTYELIGTTDVIIRLSVPGASMLPYGDSAPTKDITINGIGVSTTITLGGYDGFRALEVIGEPTLQQNDITGFVLTLNLNFKIFGDVSLQVVNSTGISIGTAVLKDFKVKPGDNNPILAVVTGDSTDAFNAVSGLRTAGETFTLTGFERSHKNLGVAGALAGLKIELPIPVIKEI
ncbi:hypothetical protein BGZ95_003464 [Linnemannia exigua]|uniref:Uncharacterized protein n=1 Tax=Linnemannia exigua TaxID=604196 RepID=A0AAD4D4M9_9FUNG|nr:hypothetical protein BGZ95_003464 [Linnemannia exigua]